MSGALNGYDGRAGLDVWEETSDESVVRGLRKWLNNKTTTDKFARLDALGGVRRHRVLEVDGVQWAVTRWNDLAELIRQAGE